MKKKIIKERQRSANTTSTRSSNTGPPARNPAGSKTKTGHKQSTGLYQKIHLSHLETKMSRAKIFGM
jgi:hypothetical protein